ncbi:xylose isomerase [Dictyobacter sp. S3.2.2.5]|uniref:Xylose isomerase n=1 Tax=Dictyobacter halimunensis TaxID=3026934 RepID=A0ABQ6FLL2_9CHLR|nr:xylose isomerase [Dictyobacter sp. S3.2.2.5]
MANYEFGAGIWMFQQFIDRYATDAYGPEVDTIKAIEKAAEVGDIRVLDINYPFAGDGVTVAEVREALKRTGIRAQAITPHLYMREFQLGSFTHPDPKIRQKAIDLGTKAIEIAHELDARYVKFWPGQDGFDYPFQVDYQRLWDNSVEGIRSVAQSDPSMQFAIEYKAKEPRSHMFFNSSARTLLAIEDMGVDNVGIVFDLGHSFFAKETPAEAVQLVARRGKLVSIELNDNWREWDDDMAVGTVHLIETLEFLAALRTIQWQGPLLLDQFPFRENSVEAARSSILTIRALERVLDRLDLNALAAAQGRHDALAAQRVVLDLLLGTGLVKDHD